LRNFIYDRLRGLLRERGYAQNEIEAVLAQQPDVLADIDARLSAVQAFAALPEAEALASANKRIANILRKTEGAEGAGNDIAAVAQPGLLRETAEKHLHAAMLKLQPEIDAAFADDDFAGALKALAQLREGVDAFFNDVMVMAEDLPLRNNRLALLAQLHRMLNRVADISKLAA
jgi:glycyl-tRNA synthetase beta chain